MIDHDEMGAFGSLASTVQVAGAALVVCTLAFQALVKFSAELNPGGKLVSAQVKLGPVSALRGEQPDPYAGKELGFIEREPVACSQGLISLEAEVISSPLDLYRSEVLNYRVLFHVECPQQIGDVLADELLLQVYGVGGNDYGEAIL